LDLNPAQKKEDRIKQAQALAQEKKIQDQQIQALKDQVAKQGNQPTYEQQRQYDIVQRRQQALRQAAQKLEAADRQPAYGSYY
jgi:tRNA U34 5-carboxymethylaminomethyl modifying GTPase MnmE/TrmE